MPNIHIVVDSTAHVPEDLLQSHANLHVVPLKVILGHREWSEPQLSGGELLALSRETNAHPKTSQPAPGDFAYVFAPLVAADHEIIVITISGQLSGTFSGAQTAARIAGGKIRVVDSGTTAIGMAKMVEMALSMAREGHSADAIVERLHCIVAATHTMFVPRTLEYLHKGGRIGGAAALLGAILQIRPVLYLTEGKVAVLDKVRTHTKAVQRMVEELGKHPNPSYIGIVHIEASEEAAKLAAQVKEMYPDAPVSLTTGGSVLASHLGPGLIGMIFQNF